MLAQIGADPEVVWGNPQPTHDPDPRMLFVGGHLHGHVHPVPREAIYWNTVHIEGKNTLDAEYTQVTYVRTPFTADDTRVEMFMVGKPTAGEVLDALAHAAGIEVTR
jgi:hypothetical protein